MDALIENDLIIQTLIHEAAHAVIGYRLGGSIEEIRISSGQAGHVALNMPGLRGFAIVSLAGAEAEKVSNDKTKASRYHAFFAGERRHPGPSSPPFPSELDLSYVRRYVAQEAAWELKENRLENTAVYRRVRAAAWEMVNQDWDAICDLAGELNKRMGDGANCVMTAADFRGFMRGK